MWFLSWSARFQQLVVRQWQILGCSSPLSTYKATARNALFFSPLRRKATSPRCPTNLNSISKAWWSSWNPGIRYSTSARHCTLVFVRSAPDYHTCCNFRFSPHDLPDFTLCISVFLEFPGISRKAREMRRPQRIENISSKWKAISTVRVTDLLISLSSCSCQD